MCVRQAKAGSWLTKCLSLRSVDDCHFFRYLFSTLTFRHYVIPRNTFQTSVALNQVQFGLKLLHTSPVILYKLLGCKKLVWIRSPTRMLGEGVLRC